ncbi:5-formyltetrahydrofolate cyclo-ligase [Streptococcus sp. sy018]|uniref:5-formyltetrahydrofolate cyclo-ligase n=1 Tax=Streptococcus sp. sy018 TaxID=2600147 RepID=UPI0011B722BC|nr:5-formyltetrahydrofolate cyclo-ligase [Streptococcus sp. sy018]TWS94950.1 5-formyltetrahydrofolate cyclo-ligase [Streptococcus sp. sy018]
MVINVTKQFLRQSMIKGLKQMPVEQKRQANRRLLDAFLTHPVYQKADCLATYLSFDFEYDTSDLIKSAQAAGKQVLVPKTFADGKMIFLPYDEDNLVRRSFGLLEPRMDKPVAEVKIDLIHVPALVINYQGYRIGFGGGYYDRYLADFSGHTLVTAYTCQLQEFLPEKHDVRVKEVVIDEG